MVAMAFLLKLIAIVLLLVALFAFYQSWKAKKSASNEGQLVGSILFNFTAADAVNENSVRAKSIFFILF